MRSLTVFCLRHRRWIVLGWLALLVAGGASLVGLSNRLSGTFDVPGEPGALCRRSAGDRRP